MAMQEEWKDEVCFVLTTAFQQQLQELRSFCEGVQSDTRDEVRRFLEERVADRGVRSSIRRPSSELSALRRSARVSAAPVLQALPESATIHAHAGARSPRNRSSMAARYYSDFSSCRNDSQDAITAASNKKLSLSETVPPEVVPPAAAIIKVPDSSPPQISLPGTVENCEEMVPKKSAPIAKSYSFGGFTQNESTRLHSQRTSKVITRAQTSNCSQASDATIMKPTESEWMRPKSGMFGGLGANARKKQQLAQLMSKLDLANRGAQVTQFHRGSGPVFETSMTYCLFHTAETVVHSVFFDYGMGMMLMLNAILMGVSVNHLATQGISEDQMPTEFRVLDMLFNVIFTVELLLRVLAFRERFFKIDAWRWNVFDTIIVSFSWIHTIISISGAGGGVLENVGVIRLLRLGRVARLVRMVRLIPELKSMVYLIMASMGSFLWALALMMILIYCMAVYFTELGMEMNENSLATDDIEKHWGSVAKSTLSLYMAVTGGDDWRNFVDVFKTEPRLYALTMVVFSIYIAFATLVMLNLVTGVFVEGAQRIIKEEKDHEIVNMAAKLFLDADDDNSQDLTLEEWHEQMRLGNLDEYIRVVGITRNEATRLFQLLDSDESGTVNVAEFVSGCLRLRGPAKAMDMADLFYNMKKQSEHSHEKIMSVVQAVGAIVESQRRCTELLGEPPDFGLEEVAALLMESEV